MRATRYSEKQIASILQRADEGAPIADLCREFKISLTTFYAWRKRYGGLTPATVRHVKQLEEENQRLKKLVAELSLDKEMLQDVIRRKT